MTDARTKDLSILEVIGPIMVGPSSSHTAGTCRIGQMCRQLAGWDIDRVDVRFYPPLMNTYQGHCTDRGLVAGLLGMNEGDPDLPSSLEIAKQRGMTVSFGLLDGDGHPGTISMNAYGKDDHIEVVGITLGGGAMEIVTIDGVDVNINGETPVTVVWGDGDGDYVIAGGNQKQRCLTPVVGAGRSKAVEPLSFARLASETDIVDIIVEYECERSGITRGMIESAMHERLSVMRCAAECGLKAEKPLLGGFASGRDGKMLWARLGNSVAGGVLPIAAARAIGIAEFNAAMGQIVAAPTGGASGVVPAVLLSVSDRLGRNDDDLVSALVVSAGVGAAVGAVASFSGAVGGCQAEIGSAAAMAAAGAVHLAGGSPNQCCHAAAIAMKSFMGLACDPAAGPVEIPCIKRNGTATATALAATDMALAGIESCIPPDEVVIAAKNVQDLMPADLRDNTLGGLGSTPSAARMKRMWECRFGC